MMDDSDLILLLESRWVTREELCVILGMADRAVRSYIEDLNVRLAKYGKCILSTSGRTGYKIGNWSSEEDIALAMRIDKELESKAISIFERRKSIRQFISYAASAKEAKKEEQLSLF